MKRNDDLPKIDMQFIEWLNRNPPLNTQCPDGWLDNGYGHWFFLSSKPKDFNEWKKKWKKEIKK